MVQFHRYMDCNLLQYQYYIADFVADYIAVCFYRFPMTTLSKLSICLNDMGLHHSPLMGHITQIVNQRLGSIDNARYRFSLNKKNPNMLLFQTKSSIQLIIFINLSQSVDHAHDQYIITAVCALAGRTD